MDSAVFLLALLLIGGILAMPIMLICSVGRLRHLREEVFELKVLLLNLQNQMRRIVQRADTSSVEPIETPKAEPVAEKTFEEKAVEEGPVEEEPVVEKPVVEEPVVEKNPVPEQERQVQDSCTGGCAEARPSPEDEIGMEAGKLGGSRFCAAEVLPESQEKVAHAIPESGERDEGDAAAYALMDKLADWLCVRGAFAPKGVSREFAVATHWLVRVGLMLLVGSIIYFVKLSIDNGWMGPTARVAGTVFWGAVGVAGGVALVKRTQYGLIGHAVAALGIVALYVGFGLGHRYFDPPVIASAGAAFAALVGVTVTAAFVSIVLPSSTIAVMSLVGGYLVPVIAGHDTGDPLLLACYLAMLNGGALVVAQMRKWSALNLLAAIFAYVVAGAWCAMHDGAADGAVLTLFAFLSIMHALYLFSSVWMAKSMSPAGRTMSWCGFVFNAIGYLSWLGFYFRPAFRESVTGLIFLGVVAGYLFLAREARRRNWLDQTSVTLILFFALVFLALAPLLLFARPWCAVSWALIALATAEARAKTGELILSALAKLLLLVAAIGMVVFGIDAYCATFPEPYVPAVFLRVLRLWTVPVAAAVMARRIGGLRLMVGAAVVEFLFLTGEAHLFGSAYLPQLHGGTITLAWLLVASGCLWFGILRQHAKLRFTGLALLGVSVVKLLLLDTAHLATPARVGVFAATGVLLIAGAFLYLKFKESFNRHE